MLNRKERLRLYQRLLSLLLRDSTGRGLMGMCLERMLDLGGDRPLHLGV